MKKLSSLSGVCERPQVSRRALLVSGGALFSWAYMPKFAHAAGGRDPRFVTIILRGALDGLSAVAPLGDPEYEKLHGVLALSRSGDHPALPLDGFFGLNPSMPIFAKMFADKQAAIVHAVATGYRERSHFDGQDVLESGYPKAGNVDSGWLNRAIASLPRGERVAASPNGLGIGPVTPLILRGAAPVTGWAPSTLPPAGGDLAERLLELYGQRDPALQQALSHGLGIEKIVARDMAATPAGGRGNVAETMRQTARGAAKLLAAEDGPRIGALAYDGWDTHANEGGATGRLAQLLGGLDGAIDEFRQTLGANWKDTIIAVVTEFGRTARINGTIGTDHGTGTVAFLAGGALNGGRVIADWPGLQDAQLYENRDLRPTTDLRSVLKGLLADHLGLSGAVLAEKVFPETGHLQPLKGLVV